MKKILLLLIGASFVAASCSSTSEPMMASSNGDKNGTSMGKTIPPTFAQFSDIPVPEGAEMDLSKTLVFGAKNKWMGRLVLSAPYSQASVFDFYLSEMPKFGWSQITVVRSKTSVLTFSHSGRVATIQLEGSGSSTDILFSMSPAVDQKTSKY